MPVAAQHLRRLLAALLLCATAAVAVPAHAEAGSAAFRKAQRLRERLDATPRASRTNAQYAQALDAYRAVYHADRSDPNADASVEAVAEILAEQGRNTHDPQLLRAAVTQLDFLRRDWPQSRFATPALLTQGEIEQRDLHDSEAARQHFVQLVQLHPSSPLASQARAELRHLGGVPPGLTASSDQSANATHLPRETARLSATPSQPESAEASPATIPQSSIGTKTPQRPYKTWTPSQPSSASTEASSKQLPAQAAPPSSQQLSDDMWTPRVSNTQRQPVPQPSAPPPVATPVVTQTVASSNPHTGSMAQVTGIRQWSTANYTRIALDLSDEVPFEASRVPNPDRIFFDLHSAHLARDLAGHAVTVTDGGFLQRIRAAQFSGDVVRVVLDVSDVSDYSAFWLPNPSRLIIDIHGRPKGSPPPVYTQPNVAQNQQPTQPQPTPAQPPRTQLQEHDLQPATSAANAAAASGSPLPRNQRTAAPGTFVTQTSPPSGAGPAQNSSGDSVAAIAALSQQPSRVRATRSPTTAPVAATTAPPPATATNRPATPTPSPASPVFPPAVVNTPSDSASSSTTATPPSIADSGTRRNRRAKNNPPATVTADVPGTEARAALPDSTGSRSMVRALGLQIHRIVIDAGHGGHDSGTLGPGGIQEKDVVLDVALRLGKLLKQRLGADVIYTRSDDTFIPLETRTAIANKAQADLFISVHANSSPDASARGVETYYLNFTTSADALEVAARENAVSNESIHQLSDLVKKITLQDKISESREFASDVQTSLFDGMQSGNVGFRNRGVKKAPFVVLIGANMPSILAEISFLTNPEDAAELRESAYRDRIAESLYRGVAQYTHSLSGGTQERAATSSAAQ